MIGEEIRQAPMRRVSLGDDEQPGRVLVEPVDDARPPNPADSRQARAAMADQRVDQRAGRMARRRMDDEAGRLVDHDQMLVLIDDFERQVLAEKRRFLRTWRLEGDPRARGEPSRRIADDGALNANLARLDQRLEARARKRDAPLGGRPPQETIEPLSGAGGVDVEGLRSGRRRQSRASRAVRLGFDPRLGRLAPGAALRLGVHARSRRRLRAPGSAAAGAARGPSAATMVSISGRAPLSWASSPRRIAATWAGFEPQQPPMMRAPQSTASPA